MGSKIIHDHNNNVPMVDIKFQFKRDGTEARFHSKVSLI